MGKSNRGREVISVYVGQCGVQMASSCWELYCLEHNLNQDGTPNENFTDKSAMENIETFFYQPKEGRFVPRAVFADLEPTVINEIRRGEHRDLFNSDYFDTSTEDGSSVFSRGYYTAGKARLPNVMDKIRKVTEKCDSLQGFLEFMSVGGGTGGGLGPLIAQRLGSDYNKKAKIGFLVYPSPKISTSVTEPYNSILSTHAMMEHFDVSLTLDNEALHGICASHLNVPRPSYTNLNRLIAQLVSSITASLRFTGSLNVDLNEFQTNLVPYPRVSYTMASYAPIVSSDSINHTSDTVKDITAQAFEPESFFTKCDPRDGSYIAVSLSYRGEGIYPSDVNQAVDFVRSKNSVKFAEWCPTGVKTGINAQKATTVPGSQMEGMERSICAVANSTAISSLFTRIGRKFDMLLKNRCFIHWYVCEGMEESEFDTARNDIATLEMDYKQMEEAIESELNNDEF